MMERPPRPFGPVPMKTDNLAADDCLCDYLQWDSDFFGASSSVCEGGFAGRNRAHYRMVRRGTDRISDIAARRKTARESWFRAKLR